jgi:hypothetical protein
MYQKKWFTTMFITTLMMFGLVLGTTTAVNASTGCGSVSSVTSDIWQEWNRLISLAVPEANMVASMVSFWNDMVGGSWAMIGPRALTTTWQSGTIVGTAGRLWIQQAPSLVSSVTVKVKKTGKKGKTGVAVCKTNSNGTTTKVVDWTFAKGSNNIGTVKSVTISNARNFVISVHLDGKSAVKQFQYQIKLKEN